MIDKSVSLSLITLAKKVVLFTLDDAEVEEWWNQMLALLAKVPVLKCQKTALRAPQFKNGLQKPRETPPKMVG